MTEKDKLLDHDYDGIKELDNPLPGWWLMTFYLAIVYAGIYFWYYHLGPGPSVETELAQGMREIESQKAIASPKGSFDLEKLNAYASDQGKLAEGKQVFTSRCAACHGASGEGSIGPNLTDKFWIHGDGGMAAIVKVVAEGVADKGMPPWGGALKPEELLTVVAYARTLQGTHPANPKAPQGNEVGQ